MTTHLASEGEANSRHLSYARSVSTVESAKSMEALESASEKVIDEKIEDDFSDPIQQEC